MGAEIINAVKASRFMTTLGLFSVLLVFPLADASCYNDYPFKKLHTIENNEIIRFRGNQSYENNFKILLMDGKSLLVGARNIVYNLSFPHLVPNSFLEWYSSNSDIERCEWKGKTSEDCHNYIRVLVKQDDNNLLVCGTNSFNPQCRSYSNEMGAYKIMRATSGIGISPYDPKDHSTFVYAEGELYTATFADFQSNDPLIYRQPLRTERQDLKLLNSPNFVSSVEYGNSIFFFFRETAVEYDNCGMAVYSRVARVCKSDMGGPQKYRNDWTTFLKSRLNCSIPGDVPFYFSEIQSTSRIITGKYGNNSEDIIYGVFNTPLNSIWGSAVCAFSMRQILETFEGPFKEQRTSNSNWLPVPENKIPEPRPGSCAVESRALPDISLGFIRTHSLMDNAVPAFLSYPLLVKASLTYQMTVIAADPQIFGTDGKTYDVLFIGTSNGRILRVVNSAPHGTDSVLIEDIQIMPSDVAIINIQVVRETPDGESDSVILVVVTDEEVSSIKAQRCFQNAKTCSECVGLQDPYCAWDAQNYSCIPVGSSHHPPESGLLQSISTGKHVQCPQSEDYSRPNSSMHSTSSPNQPWSFEDSNEHIGHPIPLYDGITREDPAFLKSGESTQIFTQNTIWVFLVVAISSSMLLGFIFGWFVSKSCQKNKTYEEAEFDESL